MLDIVGPFCPWLIRTKQSRSLCQHTFLWCLHILTPDYYIVYICLSTSYLSRFTVPATISIRVRRRSLVKSFPVLLSLDARGIMGKSGIAGIGWTIAVIWEGNVVILLRKQLEWVWAGAGGVRVVQPSIQYPLSSLSQYLTLWTIVGDLTREMATRPGAKLPLPIFNTAHGKVMPWVLWAVCHRRLWVLEQELLWLESSRLEWKIGIIIVSCHQLLVSGLS